MSEDYAKVAAEIRRETADRLRKGERLGERALWIADYEAEEERHAGVMDDLRRRAMELLERPGVERGKVNELLSRPRPPGLTGRAQVPQRRWKPTPAQAA